jgi:hypothetical protein
MTDTRHTLVASFEVHRPAVPVQSVVSIALSPFNLSTRQIGGGSDYWARFEQSLRERHSQDLGETV